MPTPRIPPEMHRKRGSWRADRHGSQSAPTAPPTATVGEPPAHLSELAAEVWRELSVAGWWLTPADRAPLEVACHAQVALRGGPTAALLSAASKSLADLGLTPRARGAVVGLSPQPQESSAEKLRAELYLDDEFRVKP